MKYRRRSPKLTTTSRTRAGASRADGHDPGDTHGLDPAEGSKAASEPRRGTAVRTHEYLLDIASILYILLL